MAPLIDSHHRLTQSFELWPFNLDMTGQYPLSQILSRLVHTAEMHADAFGFGVGRLQERGLTWILHRISIEYLSPLSGQDAIEISTGVLRREGLSTDRAFVIRQQGVPRASAMSRWVAIQIDSRRPVPVREVIPAEAPLSEVSEVTFPSLPRRVLSPEEEARLQEVFTYTAKYSDLDINRHINSAIWVARAMDAVSPQRFEEQHLKRADIHFLHEGVMGERLTILKTSEGDRDAVAITKEGSSTPSFTLALNWI